MKLITDLNDERLKVSNEFMLTGRELFLCDSLRASLLREEKMRKVVEAARKELSCGAPDICENELCEALRALADAGKEGL